ncbi:hypothetical protein VTN77DRAFT_4706 [Rasamsonia byssochlamydoides]|uniref:uncharacterized protein n=1 Tax=Rasamsonia byssochlamydoides TaxID=89139 RepID=UPI0037439676
MTPFFIPSLLLSLLPLIGAQSTFSPARPPAIPLAVRSPYLSTWLNVGKDGGNGGYLAGEWPVFWSNQITGWAGLIRVDGHAYTWLGAPGAPAVNQTAYEYTTTKSIFTFNVDDLVEMTVTFLSPITPNDFKRQSLIFSYLNVDVKSLDGGSHDVQLYADISAEWISGDRTTVAQWDYGVTGNVAYHRVYRQTQLLFSEVSDQAEWGYWYWATDNVAGLTYQSGQDVVVRGLFENNGTLANSQDKNYRAIQDNWPVFAFAYDLGSVGSSTVSRLFSLGLTQEQAVQYAGPNGTVSVPSLWTSYFSNELEAVEFFQGDYANANSLSSALDSKVATNSTAAGGQDYLTLTSLSARQAFGATQLCGTPDKTYLFMKEISSDGNVNTVDVIFPAHPVLLYTNPTLLKLLLDPLFEIQEAGLYPNQWAMHDVGSSYPNATGHPTGNDEQMPLEECGNMVIMTLAYYMGSKDLAYLKANYKILKQWTSFLVQEALYPANQISTDDFAGALPNQTNLALKGMIGIQAMSVIAGLTGNVEDSKNFSSIAHSYITQWQTLGVAHDANPPHSTLSYGQNATWGLLYNLFADKELNLGLVPQSVYDMQSTFYRTVSNQYGVPLDTRHTYTKGDWLSFCAAIASKETQQMLFKDLATWINNTPTNRALTDLYDTISGDYPDIFFVARPVMGGAFALLALGLGLSN